MTSGTTLARQSLEVGGLRLAYVERGEPSGQPPVVLLHGWGASVEAVASIQACLATDLRVIAFDLPGFGQSDPPPTTWSNADYADLLRRALDRLGLEGVSVVGHSRGGAIGIVLAATWPALIHRLVLVDSAGIRPRRSPAWRARVMLYKLARRAAGRGLLGEALARRFGSADYRAASGVMRSTLVRMVNEDLRSLMPRIAAPTLIVWGDQDQDTPLSDAAIMEREIPDAGLVVFPGAGHYAYADDLPRFCRVVGHFLRG